MRVARSLCLAMALTGMVMGATPLFAQSLPMFDETAGFEVVGVADGDGLIVTNAGNAFFCQVDEGEGFLALAECWPILGPKAGAAAAKAAMSAEEREETLIAALEKLPDAAFFPAIELTMREAGCLVDFSTGEEPFIAALSFNVAKQMGHDVDLSPDAREEIGRITEGAAEAMMEMGRIIVDRSASTARLDGCEN